MTPVPVVSTRLNTRTAKRCTKACSEGHQYDAKCVLGPLVVDPVFVVLPAVPDLTCRECDGHPWLDCDHPEHNEQCRRLCPSCGGTGVSPVYAATWQWRALPEFKVGDVWHAPGSDTTANRLFAAIGRTEADYADAFERRQVVEWRATDVTVLPVVDEWGYEGTSRNHLSWQEHIAYAEGGPYLYSEKDDGWGWVHRKLAEPWAVDLRPGQFVLRLDGWEHLQQPHTEMTCRYCHGRPLYEVSSKTGENLDRLDCHCDNEGVLPLSVPDGVLSWIELA